MKIALIDRINARESPGGDTVQIRAIAKVLISKGHTVQITAKVKEVEDADLAVLFNLTRPYELIFQYLCLKKKNIPFLLFPIYWNLDRVIPSTHQGIKKYLPRWLKEILRSCKFLTCHWREMKSFEINGFQFLMKNRRIKELLTDALKICPNSNAEAEIFIRDFGGYSLDFEQKIQVINNGIDMHELTQIGTVPEELENLDYICCVGAIGPRKNQLNLIKAANLADIPLVLVGGATKENQPYLQQLQQIAGPKIYFLGHRDRRDTLAIIRNSIGHIQPSFIETPGLASMEAAALGKPVVVSDTGPTREYFQEFATYCNPHSVSSISWALQVLMERKNSRDESLCTHIIENYQWSKVLEPLNELLKSREH
jgi:glycosyltransferase involved in cell wall biosynthesis